MIIKNYYLLQIHWKMKQNSLLPSTTFHVHNIQINKRTNTIREKTIIIIKIQIQYKIIAIINDNLILCYCIYMLLFLLLYDWFDTYKQNKPNHNILLLFTEQHPRPSRLSRPHRRLHPRSTTENKYSTYLYSRCQKISIFQKSFSKLLVNSKHF